MSKPENNKPSYGKAISPDEHDPKYLKAKDAVLMIPEQHGINMTDEQKAAYENALDWYILDKTIFANPPTLKEVRDFLYNLHKAADKFSECVSNIEPHRIARLLFMSKKGRSKKLHTAKTLAEEIGHAANVAYLGLEARRSTKGSDTALSTLIVALAGLYKQCTGKKPTISNRAKTTKFSSFVHDVLAAFGDTPQSEEAMSQRIYRTMRKNKQ